MWEEHQFLLTLTITPAIVVSAAVATRGTITATTTTVTDTYIILVICPHYYLLVFCPLISVASVFALTLTFPFNNLEAVYIISAFNDYL